MSKTVGERVYEIRSALGPDSRHEMPQREFAALVNQTAKRLKKDVSWTDSTVVRVEKNERRLQLEEAEVIATLDPQKRGAPWVAFGVVTAEADVMPDPAQKASRRSRA